MKKESKSLPKELYFKGHLDCLYFYSKHIKEISNFIDKQEVASKIHIPPNGVFLRRGSKDEPLFIKEMTPKVLTSKFFELRTKVKRAEAIEQKLLTRTQEKIWLYFPPNKPVEFFYATNGEHPNKPISRIFIDIDRRNLTTKQALIVTKALIEEIKNDKEFNKLFSQKQTKIKTIKNHNTIMNKNQTSNKTIQNYNIKILFTGSSYHVYLFLKKPISHDFYEKYIAYSKNEKIPSFISKWAKKITKSTRIPVTGGHEKTKDIIILDPSGTPSGKLARVPFSVHVKNAQKSGRFLARRKKSSFFERNKIDAVAELVEI